MKKLQICLSVVLLLLLIVASQIYLSKRSKPETFGEYELYIDQCTYNSITKTGIIELTSTHSGNGLEKLFYTANDLLKNGFFDILDDEYSLQITQGNQLLLHHAYEADYSGQTQSIKIYFINSNTPPAMDSININILDTKTSETKMTLSQKCSKTKDCKYYDAVEAPASIAVSSSGLLFNHNAVAAFQPPYLTASCITLIHENQNYLLALSPSLELPPVDGITILDTKAYFKDDRKRTYALEIENWDDLKEIKIGEITFLP